MNKHIMLDIEATGIDWHKEELLSVGMLECDFNGDFWVPGRAHEWILHCDREPMSEFAKANMQVLYARCNVAPVIPMDRLRWEIIEFLRACGTTGVEDTFMMGWNASNFDLPFLAAKGLLFPSRYELQEDGTDRMVGDFHYRIYEIGGAVGLAQNVVREKDRKRLTEAARNAAAGFLACPAGKQHDALYDCYEQLRLLNGLIEIMRRGWV